MTSIGPRRSTRTSAFGQKRTLGADASKKLERVKGIEPSSSAWEAAALPLSYTRVRGASVAKAPGFVHALRAAVALLESSETGE